MSSLSFRFRFTPGGFVTSIGPSNSINLPKSFFFYFYMKCTSFLIISRQFIFSEASAREARSDAPYLRKIGNSSSRENLVMTLTSVRANAVRTDSGAGGGAPRGKAHGGWGNVISSQRDL